MLSDEELRDALRACPPDCHEPLRTRWLYAKDFARAIESAATAPLLARIAELEKDCDRLERNWNEAMATHRNIAELERELEEAKKDAERYYSRETDARWRALIADDGYAMTFQSIGQYRSALLKALTPNTEAQGRR